MKLEFSKVKLENGETMAYRYKKGRGYPLILIHGFQSSSRFFTDLIFSLNEDIRIYAIDLIGYGDSSYNKKHEKMLDWAYDLYYFLKAMDIKKANILGWSLGGQVGMDFAGVFPSMVKNLILVASVGCKGFIMPNKSLNIKIPQFMKDFQIKHDKSFTIPILNGIKDEDIDFFEDIFKQTVFNVKDPNPNVLMMMTQDFIKQDCFLESLLAMIKYDNTKTGTNLIKNLTMPITWIHGDKDMIVPISDAYNSIGKFPQKINFIKFENSGHVLFVDEKERFVKIINDLLDR